MNVAWERQEVPTLAERTLAERALAERALAERAQRRLVASPYPELHRARCEQRDDEIVIRGTVSSFYLKQIAQTEIRKVPGDFRVNNQLEVVSN